MVVFESLSAEFDVLVAYICKDCCLRMDFVVFTSLSDNAALYVAEKTMRDDIRLKKDSLHDVDDTRAHAFF